MRPLYNGHRRNHLDKLHDRYAKWLEKVKAVPKDYPTLTEEQWLAACNHFDGCARCSCKEVDTRGFFVGAKQGGRYCDWNIIPLCERCASSWNLDKSMFVYTEIRDHHKRSTEHREGIDRIVEYLGGKLDVAAGIKD